jgi:hypothetical protein
MQEVAVTVETADGDTVTGAVVEWESSNDQVIRISPAGVQHHVLLTAQGMGEAEVTATVTGGIGTVPQTVLRDTVHVSERWVAVGVGRNFTCGLNVDSAAYCWTFDLQPASVPGLFEFAARNLEVGHTTACVVVLSETPYCWGQNSLGEIGTFDVARHPVAVEGALHRPPNALQRLSAGGTFFCGDFSDNVQTDGPDFIYCWGNSAFRQLGGAPDTEECNFNFEFYPCGVGPDLIMLSDSLDAGESHACAIEASGLFDPTGPVLCWGAGTTGQLGPRGGAQLERCPTQESIVPTGVPCGSPAVVDPELRFVSVSAGWDVFSRNFSSGSEGPVPSWLTEGHTCAVDVTQTVYCWGKNDHGQLGAASSSICVRAVRTFELQLDPTVPCRSTPRPVLAPAPATFNTVSAGSEHTCGIMTDERVYCWGNNAAGQLGDGGTTSRRTPAAIASERHFVSLSAGPQRTCGVTTPEGAIFCWGEGVGEIPLRVSDPR